MLELLATDTRGDIQDVLAWTLCVAAIVLGRQPERAVAVTWLVLFEIAPCVYIDVLGYEKRLTGTDPFFASTDVLAGFLFVGIALYANRNYPLWIAGMQVLAVTGHLARGLVEAISPIGYVILTTTPGWFQLVFFAIGLTRHILRTKKFGPYRDWRLSKPVGPVSPLSDQTSWLSELVGKPPAATKDET